jgi:release factor glutamine methyltransferase
LQYIIGKEEFRGLEFKVTRDTLIPRPETELLVEQAVLLAQTMKIADGCGIFIDLCTGSGCVAVSLAKEIPYAVVYATDISSGALETARENAKRHGVANRVIFVEGDLFAPLIPFDLYGKASFILSNPPYVAKADFEKLQPEIKDYEPAGALLAGQDGLEFYRRIIPGSLDYLKQGGYLIMEIGYGQAKDLLRLIEENGSNPFKGMFSEMEFIKDQHGIDRVLRARKAVARL